MNRCAAICSSFRALSISCVALGLVVPAASPAQSVTAGSCRATFASPLQIPISGTLRELVIDPQCQHVFITNATTNRVEVISLVTGRLGAPIDVGSNPNGIDVTPDGSTLYVATTGANFVSVVNVATGIQSGTIPIPPQFDDDTPFSISIANNGLALLTTTFAGSGAGGRLLQLNLATGAVTQRTDASGGTTTEATELRASSDKSTIGVVVGDSDAAPVFAYLAATNQFTPVASVETYLSRIATNGAALLADNFEFAVGSMLQQTGVFPLLTASQLFDVAVDPSGKVGYRTWSSYGGTGANSVEVLDLQRTVVTGSLPVGDTLGFNGYIGYPTSSGVGHMAISGDGSLLAVITDHGVSLVQPNPVIFTPFLSFAASVSVETSPTAGTAQLQVVGSFVPGVAATIDFLHQDVSLNVGSCSTVIPAGALHREGSRYVYRQTSGKGTLTVTIQPGMGSGYEFVGTASGVTLGGSTLPIIVSMAIGPNQGSIALSAIAGRFTQQKMEPP